MTARTSAVRAALCSVVVGTLATACSTVPEPAPAAASAGAAADAGVPTRNVATMSELMVDVLYPASDAVFYIQTRTPSDSDEWAVLQMQTLMIAETANLLMMPDRARDRDRWMEDAELMLDAGEAAYRAAKDRNVDALVALNDQLYQSCVRCHVDYRPGYGR